jgi:clathrin heavy chain
LTLESGHVIRVREQVGKQNQVVIIDLADANNVLRRPITPDPHSKIIVLKGVLFLARASVTCFIANRTLQIFNIDTKQKVKSHLNSEDVVFWK